MTERAGREERELPIRCGRCGAKLPASIYVTGFALYSDGRGNQILTSDGIVHDCSRDAQP